MSSSRSEYEDEILEQISRDAEIRARVEAVPDRVAQTVREFVPVDTGTAEASIEVQARRTPFRRLSTRRIKIGEVGSDDDIAKIQTLEYGRAETDDNGGTPEFAMFRKAWVRWMDVEI